MMDPSSISPQGRGAVRAARRLHDAGFVALLAGGCVRDMLLGREPKDFDIATDAPPGEVLRLFPRSTAVGKAFGVVRVREEGHEYEVATFRKDNAYSDGRHPDTVTFAGPEADALRRDFTINALFFDPLAGRVHDYVGGRKDVERRVVRAVGDPAVRFGEDHLRMLRAVRFQSTLLFSMHPRTLDAIRANAPSISRVSNERIQQELTRILVGSSRAGGAMDMLSDAGLLREILPEVEAMKGQEQPREFHPEGDVYVHTLKMLDAMEEPAVRLAYAVLLHDVGKPRTAKTVGGRIRFDNHARVGAAMSAEIMKRLRMPSEDVRAVAFCVGNHMRFMDVRRMKRSTLARLAGAPTFPVELELHRLDCAASHKDMSNYDFLVEFREALRSEPVLPAPLITGRDILDMGAEEGPLIGEWKKRAYDAQLEGRFGGRDEALAWLKSRFFACRPPGKC